MRTIIFSDVHIGDPRLDDSNLLKIFENEPFERLIMNGDIVDLWLCSIEEIKKHPFVKKINELAKTKEIYWITGNHDYYKNKEIIPNIHYYDVLDFKEDNKIIRFLHGHQVYLNKNNSFFNRFFARINLLINKYFKIDFQKIFNSTKSYGEYIENKRKIILEKFGNDVDIIVMGHTHRIGYLSNKKTELFDLGSLSYSRSYAVLENGSVWFKILIK